MKRKNRMITAGLVVLSSVIWFPLFFMAAQSLMGSTELIKNTEVVPEYAGKLGYICEYEN